MRRLLFAALLATFATLPACRPGSDRAPMNPDPATNTYAPALGVNLSAFTKQPSGLYVRDDTIGTGAVAEQGRTVEVHYTGWLPDGDKFDASRDHGESFRFTLGRQEVIAGWDEGVAGMRVGGTRTLLVPPTLGYGAEGAGGVIPPNAVLVFRVELLGVR